MIYCCVGTNMVGLYVCLAWEGCLHQGEAIGIGLLDMIRG